MRTPRNDSRLNRLVRTLRQHIGRRVACFRGSPNGDPSLGYCVREDDYRLEDWRPSNPLEGFTPTSSSVALV